MEDNGSRPPLSKANKQYLASRTSTRERLNRTEEVKIKEVLVDPTSIGQVREGKDWRALHPRMGFRVTHINGKPWTPPQK